MTSAGTGETRVVAVVGPYSSGKTRLMEAVMVATGAAHAKGPGQRVVGDASAESKAREMGIDLNVGSFSFMGERFTFLDSPGAIELAQEGLNVLPVADAAIIVCEPDVGRIIGLAPIFHRLEALGIPRFVVLNKIDRATGSISEMAEALRSVSGAPIVLRQIPVRRDGHITGYVDLAEGKAHVYRAGQASEIIDVPADLKERLAHDRQAMLETLADYDDHLLEELLEGIDPPQDEIYSDLALDVQDGKIVPVFLAAAEQGFGVRRLLKALRHELPAFSQTLDRLQVNASAQGACAAVIKTVQTPHAGKLSVARVLRGTIKDGDTLNDQRVSGIMDLTGLHGEKLAQARAGDVVGLGRLDGTHTGDTLSTLGKEHLTPAPRLTPVFTRALDLANKADDVKLSGALAKLIEEDPSLSQEHHAETHELLLRGQGDIQLAIATDRLKSRFGLTVTLRAATIPYRETIRKGTTQHSRFKRQSGGHGQFGDATIEVRPQQPGEGFLFEDAITGGAIPRQYIPSVEEGVIEGLKTGPLGFPVVDVAVRLLDGKYHTVDSSDMAFHTTGRQAIHEALPNCAPVLLEPVLHVLIHVPNEFTAKATQLVTTRRGAILKFDARSEWPGWDTVEGHIPQSEMDDLIIDLRSMTQGAGSFESRFDHHQELVGRLADQIVAERKTHLGRAGQAA